VQQATYKKQFCLRWRMSVHVRNIQVGCEEKLERVTRRAIG